MAFVSTPHSLEFYFPGEPTVDRFGNERPGLGEWALTAVASWWIERTEEKSDDSVLRTVNVLTIHVPEGFEPPPSGQVRTPDGTVWDVEGNAEDYTHGWHGWNPGLLVLHCKKVEG